MRDRAEKDRYFEEIALGLFRRFTGDETVPAPKPGAAPVEAPPLRSLRTLAVVPVDCGHDTPDDVGFKIKGEMVSVGGKPGKDR